MEVWSWRAQLSNHLQDGRKSCWERLPGKIDEQILHSAGDRKCIASSS